MPSVLIDYSRLSNVSWVFDAKLDLRVRLTTQDTVPITQHGRFYIGALTGCDEVFVVSAQDAMHLELEPELLIPYGYRGEEVERYTEVHPDRRAIYPYKPGPLGEAKLLTENELKKYRRIYNHLSLHKNKLTQRQDSRRYYAQGSEWYCYLRPGRFHYLLPIKFLIRGIATSAHVGLLGHHTLFNGANCPGFIFDETTELNRHFILAIINSNLTSQFLIQVCPPKLQGYSRLNANNLNEIRIPKIAFTTPTDRRNQLAEKGRKLYQRCLSEGHACVLEFCAHHLAGGESDVVHDLLAFLAEQMIDLNQQKQAETKRFLAWLEGRLRIQPKDGQGGIDSLTGKTILQNYLGDYQKDEPPRPWDDFLYRLHQNRRRFAVRLADVQGEIQAEYERSLAVLLPLKAQLASTDALIDKIVYQLYGLTPAEIELIERPHYEQALAAAKAKTLTEIPKTPPTDQGTAAVAEEEYTAQFMDAVAAKVLPAAHRLLDRIDPADDRTRLAADLPGYELLPVEVVTFLLTGEYNIRTLPDHLDFSTSVIGYTKAVETTLLARLFEPFRSESGYGAGDCTNPFLQGFMTGSKKLTLGNMPIILKSGREGALRAFAQRRFAHADQTLFGAHGVATLLDDPASLTLRNQAAHDAVLTRGDAQQAREWALAVLRLL